MHFPSSVDFAILKNKITAMRKSTGTQSEGLRLKIQLLYHIFVTNYPFMDFNADAELVKIILTH